MDSKCLFGVPGIPPGSSNPFQSSSCRADLPKLQGDLVPITRFRCIK